jgi:hypothetical protein
MKYPEILDDHCSSLVSTPEKNGDRLLTAGELLETLCCCKIPRFIDDQRPSALPGR